VRIESVNVNKNSGRSEFFTCLGLSIITLLEKREQFVLSWLHELQKLIFKRYVPISQIFLRSFIELCFLKRIKVMLKNLGVRKVILRGKTMQILFVDIKITLQI